MLYFPRATSVGKGGRDCCAHFPGLQLSQCFGVRNTCMSTDLKAPQPKNTDAFVNLGLTECMGKLRKFKWTWKLFKYAFSSLLRTFICTSGLENLKPQDQLFLGWLVCLCNKAKCKHGRRGCKRQLPSLLAVFWTEVLHYGDLLSFSLLDKI